MQKFIPAFVIGGVLVIAGWLVWGSINPAARPSLPQSTTTAATTTLESPVTSYECDGDGKVCPDGSVVGRTGPKCEFTACPPAEAKSATIRTTMGQVMSGLNVSITPRQVVDDSRCPTDVQCIWAGTVHVRVTIKTPKSTADVTLEIGKPIEKDGYTITFTELTPGKNSGETIPDSSYRFVFTVSK